MGTSNRKQVQSLRTCVVVVGATDPATEAMDGLLGALGCELPSSGAGSAQSRRIAEFNDELFASAGTAADDFTSFHRDWLKSPVAPEFSDRALALLEEEFGNAPLFVLSDTRMGRLIPFWTAVLERSGTAAKIVVVIAADSAANSGSANKPLNQLVSLRQLLDSEYDTRALPRLFVTHDQLVRQWDKVAGKASQAFQLLWPRSIDSAEFEVAAVLASTGPASATPGTPWLGETVEILSRWSAKGEAETDRAALDRIRSEFDTASKAFARVIHAAAAGTSSPRRLATGSRGNGRGPSSDVRPRQPTGSNDVESLKALLQEQRRNATLLNADLQQQIEAREALEAQLIEAQAEIAANRARRKEMARVINNREAKISRLNEEVTARYEDLAKLQRQMVRSNPLWMAKAAAKRINRAVRPPAKSPNC